jgi:hypothetical protein
MFNVELQCTCSLARRRMALDRAYRILLDLQKRNAEPGNLGREAGSAEGEATNNGRAFIVAQICEAEGVTQ